MLYITSDRDNNYYADFRNMAVLISDKISRKTSVSRIKFNLKTIEFTSEKKLPEQVLLFLLPLFEKHQKTEESAKDALKMVAAFRYDLDDSACRDFNSFEKGPR